MRRWLVAGLVALAVMASMGVGAEAAASTTHVDAVSPLNAEGHLRPRYTVTAARRGYCWTSSSFNGRLYRCIQGNLIRDPCWKESGRRSVVCLGTPRSRSVVRIRLTRRLPATNGYGPRIWGLRRRDGVGGTCLANTGAGEWIGNRRVNYYCKRGWVLVGSVDRDRPRWTIATARRVAGHYQLRGRKPLATAWKPVR